MKRFMVTIEHGTNQEKKMVIAVRAVNSQTAARFAVSRAHRCGLKNVAVARVDHQEVQA